jgi:hypothetical protein
MGAPEKKYILDADGSGVALLDYDNDGWLDIYRVNGSTFDAQGGVKELEIAAVLDPKNAKMHFEVGRA